MSSSAALLSLEASTACGAQVPLGLPVAALGSWLLLNKVQVTTSVHISGCAGGFSLLLNPAETGNMHI